MVPAIRPESVNGTQKATGPQEATGIGKSASIASGTERMDDLLTYIV